MKIVYRYEEYTVVNTSTMTPEDMGSSIKDIVGVGEPFFAFNEIPDEIEGNIAADFTNAPTVKGQASANEAAIESMLADTALQALPNDKVFAAS
jgi:hypothetical protein